MAELEEWRPVVGGDGWYEVSDLGRVRSWVGRGRRRRRELPHIMARRRAGAGYLKVDLSAPSPRQGPAYVHHLVLEAFVGRRPAGFECCHGTAGRSDNGVANLRWCSHAENMAEVTKAGTKHKGPLPPATVRSIRRDYALGSATYVDLAIAHGITANVVGRIVRRERYGWLTD